MSKVTGRVLTIEFAVCDQLEGHDLGAFLP